MIPSFKLPGDPTCSHGRTEGRYCDQIDTKVHTRPTDLEFGWIRDGRYTPQPEDGKEYYTEIPVYDLLDARLFHKIRELREDPALYVE